MKTISSYSNITSTTIPKGSRVIVYSKDTTSKREAADENIV